MGCSGFLKNLDQPKEIILTCYECSRSVSLDNPIKGHEDCLKEDTDSSCYLRVTLHIDDYDSR